MAGAIGGLISLPTWATNWTEASVRSFTPSLTVAEDALLAEIVETIIPATDTPGAKALGVHTLIQKIVADCYDQPSQEKLKKGLETVSAMAQQQFGKDFAAADATQRTALLQSLSQSADAAPKEFFSFVKGLTIRGYMTSEYVMTNLTHYVMAPGYYHGCVPVPATKAVSQTPAK